MASRRTAPRGPAAPAVEPLPMFSTVDAGRRITWLAEGHAIGRMTGAVRIRLAVTVLLWASVATVPLTAVLGLAPTPRLGDALGSPWVAAAAVVCGFVAVQQTSGLVAGVRSQFGQARVAGLFGGLGATGGIAVAAAAWTAASYTVAPVPPFDLDRIADSPSIPRELGVLVGAAFALWSLTIAVRLLRAVPQAQARQQTLQRLREAGTPFAGRLTSVTFRNLWVHDRPHFHIQVDYATPHGVEVEHGHMVTTADRVPTVGTSVRVWADGTGATAMELDDSRPIIWEPEDRYRASEG